jgi:IMP dehydrogenase
MQILDEIGLTYDDLLLLPRYSNVPSRTSPNIDIELAGYKVKPIIAANMKSIANLRSFEALGKIGITVPFHRMQNYQDRLQEALGAIYIRKKEHLEVPVFVSIGLGELEFFKETLKYDGIDGYILELAHAAHSKAESELQAIRELLVEHKKLNKTLIVGNYGLPHHLPQSRIIGRMNIIWKSGIGPGSSCETRQVTGNGVPMATMIGWFNKITHKKFIADGGIKTSGDIVKALALGANFVMIGGLFACKQETENYFAGMASERDGKIRPGIAPEGTWYEKEKSGSVVDVGNKLIWGVRQGLAMQGAINLGDLRANATFIRITQNGVTENLTRKF